jgi:hypothetical protein
MPRLMPSTICPSNIGLRTFSNDPGELQQGGVEMAPLAGGHLTLSPIGPIPRVLRWGNPPYREAAMSPWFQSPSSPVIKLTDSSTRLSCSRQSKG